MLPDPPPLVKRLPQSLRRITLLREASLDALAPLRDLAATDEPVDKEVLEHLLSRLQQGRQRLPRD
jgi:hypothetical protein